MIYYLKSLADTTAVCSTANVAMMKLLGADKVIDYTMEDFSKNGETYDIIMDTVGKSPFSASVRSLKKNGRYIRVVHIALAFIFKGIWISITGSKKVIGGSIKETAEDLVFFTGLIESGKLKPVIDRTYPLEQVADAHYYVEKGHKKGNVVVTV